jgi:hypothetical protein
MEAFFAKKKIDLQLLQASEPGLYEVLKEHFHQMGAKSFDHTKKYHFNKWRIKYPLLTKATKELPLVENTRVEASQEVIPSLSEKTKDSSVSKPTGFKPRFKSATTPARKENTEEQAQNIDAKPQETSVSKPTGFKPRFKSATTPAPKENTEKQAQTPPSSEDSTP